MKKNIFSIVMSTMCGTLTSVLGIQMILSEGIGLAAVLLLLLSITLFGIIRTSILDLYANIRIAEIDAGLKQLRKIQEMHQSHA